ncbi:MAG: DUF2945 domain-containing protein [Pyrinomonadaceae bacterium]|nr:DUF2945 domain-containing protein [Pyrinomonadaceae bacterium]
MAEQKLKKGDKVSWKSHGGEAHGKVVKIVHEDGSIEDFDYKASKDDPRYIVETDEGKKAAHKEDALKKG